ncbi:hypothetical protein [Streptomyces sp. NPDC005549]|uniref:hypothetical protein n=1 Tax=Streptomyces sp. NPDC005549 TaxID=3154888 RepID=UPI0033B21F7C
MTEDPMVAALLREREGCVQRGLDARVAAIDEQLKARGHTPSKTEAKPGDDVRTEAPKGRRARRTETA